MSRHLHGLARQLAPVRDHMGFSLHGAVVTAVHAATASTPASVDVQIDGSAVTVPGVQYWPSYSPTVGDFVYVERTGRTVRVRGPLA